jgi:hypothetical protein
MDNDHPMAVRARQARMTRELEKDVLNSAKRKFDLRFLTVGKYTVCYRVDRSDVIELSTAIKHPNDRLDRHVGRMQAFDRFVNNNRILLKSEQGFSPKRFLEKLFSTIQ